MKAIAVVVTIVFMLSGCQSAPMKWQRPVAVSTSTIEIDSEKDGDKVCVKKTKTKKQNCRHWNDDETCNIPGDTIQWVWKKNDAVSFKIRMKDGFANPFQNDASCTSASTNVVCKLPYGADRNRFYDYDIVVGSGDTECTYDPRILIY